MIDHIKNGNIQLVINTPSGKISAGGSNKIRRALLRYGIPYATTLSGAMAMALGIKTLISGIKDVKPLQEYHREINPI